MVVPSDCQRAQQIIDSIVSGLTYWHYVSMTLPCAPVKIIVFLRF